MNDLRPPIGPPPSKLPEGWKKVWSDEYKEHYYVNHSTGQSTWEKPVLTQHESVRRKPLPVVKQELDQNPAEQGAQKGPAPIADATHGSFWRTDSLYGGTDKVHLNYIDETPVAIYANQPWSESFDFELDRADKFYTNNSNISFQPNTFREVNLHSALETVNPHATHFYAGFVANDPEVANSHTDLELNDRQETNLRADLEVNSSSEAEALSGYDFDVDQRGIPASRARTAWSFKHSCYVSVKRFDKTDSQSMADAWREIIALSAISDPAVPCLLEHFETQSTMFIVLENREGTRLHQFAKQMMATRGSFPQDILKSLITQLFSALSVIFMAGFAHLKICDETVFVDTSGHLTITEFDYAHEYSKDKAKDLYAAIGAKYDSNIFSAPESFAEKVYNGRKAVIWSCGVLIYYLVTGGQTSHLKSCLPHPAFTSSASGTQRSLSHATPSLSTFSSNTRKALSTVRSSSSKTKLFQVTYPTHRSDIPSYVRDIISKMLIVDPLKRAELIEVATKVPKEVKMKETRPLVELAWLDYKKHVGPLAGRPSTGGSIGVPELYGSGRGASMFSVDRRESGSGRGSDTTTSSSGAAADWAARRAHSIW